jgi:D-threonate/D-erythronate kinase
MRILIIADDLTGAADSAVQFRQAGFSAVVLADPPRPRTVRQRAQVISLSLNTRDASPAAVARIWERHASTITAMAQGALVYQKIDSTLRGHPAREVRLLLGYLGASVALIAPAFPKLGRQTIDGVHRVYGVPLAETEYAHSHTRARASSRLPELFSVDASQSPVHLPLQIIEEGPETVSRWLQHCLAGPSRFITADAADERHLDILTQAALPHVGRLLLVGSAGWAGRLALACQERLAPTPAPPGVLAVVGSLSAVATLQVQAALQAGVTVVQYPTASTPPMVGATAQDWQSVTQALVSGRPAILWSHSGDPQAASHRVGARILRALAGIVRDILATTPVSSLAIVGGDTAQAVLRALHASGLVLTGEMMPGLPYGRLLDGPWAGLLTATKAGGFGSELVLRDCLEFLHRQAAPLSR